MSRMVVHGVEVEVVPEGQEAEEARLRADHAHVASVISDNYHEKDEPLWEVVRRQHRAITLLLDWLDETREELETLREERLLVAMDIRHELEHEAEVRRRGR